VLSGLENPVHIMFILAVLLIVFGPKRLPELGRNLGRGIRDFRSALSDHEHGLSATAPPPAAAATVEPAPPVAAAPSVQPPATPEPPVL
jgi:sec-independent protein translocase protein TatA